jgi:hypothetical protein
VSRSSKLSAIRAFSYRIEFFYEEKYFSEKKTFFLPDFTGPILALASRLMNEKVFSL